MMRGMNCGIPVSGRTAWHVTVGTYCTRLHGGVRATVDRAHNQRGQPFVGRDEQRERSERETARAEPVYLTDSQRALIERVLPDICVRGGWTYFVCAAPPPPENDHFHILLDAPVRVHGKDVRKWLKRWLTEAMDAQFGRPEGGAWWVEGGSTKPVKDEAYFRNVFNYVRRQRTTAFDNT